MAIVILVSVFEQTIIIQLLFFIGHLYLSGLVVMCGSKNGFQQDMVLNNGRLNSQHMKVGYLDV